MVKNMKCRLQTDWFCSILVNRRCSEQTTDYIHEEMLVEEGEYNADAITGCRARNSLKSCSSRSSHHGKRKADRKISISVNVGDHR